MKIKVLIICIFNIKNFNLNCLILFNKIKINIIYLCNLVKFQKKKKKFFSFPIKIFLKI